MSDLDCALQGAKRRFTGAKAPWMKVLGPAGAVVTSLARIDRRCPAASLWIDDLGNELDLLSMQLDIN